MSTSSVVGGLLKDVLIPGGPVFGRGPFLIFYVVASSIAARITAFRMRRRIRKATGETASDAQLLSINNWMKVTSIEQQREASKPMEPK
jgi:hypothetical protein